MASDSQRTKLELIQEHPEVLERVAIAVCQQRPFAAVDDKERTGLGGMSSTRKTFGGASYQLALGFGKGYMATAHEPGAFMPTGFANNEFREMLLARGWRPGAWKGVEYRVITPPLTVCAKCKHVLQCTLAGVAI